MIHRELIERNFSKHAKEYDRYSTVQNLCAKRLVKDINYEGFRKILDVGCGTGNLTALLLNKFPLAQIKAIDISKGMIKVAKNKLSGKRITFAVADGESICFKERFDLISSNASFQWFENLQKALSIYKRLLSKGGLIIFSIFGPNTFCELSSSLSELLGKEVKIQAHSFTEKGQIKEMLRASFNKIEIEQVLLKEKNTSLLALLKKIKYTGTRGNGISGNLTLTPKILRDIEKIYRNKFNEIIATYEVYFCKGVK
ncbi:MAG: malonyl-ACP O-methyltransferase BioC [Candidatus Omnitrophica bacterium]|nr:malonyl-ACP O-methyltransferase BioC [Candidatus Omnitrophota bacterium]